jgi:hypothetical protein
LQKEIASWSTGGVPFSREASNAVASYAAIRSELDQTAVSNDGQYQESVLNNVTKWQQHVTNELGNLVKEHKSCIQQLEHYEQKVDNLLDVLARLEARGPRIAYKASENLQKNKDRLDRNKEKLVEAKKNYLACDSRVRRAEEVVDYSWMVLCPLIVELMKVEVCNANEIANIKSKLHVTIHDLTKAMKEEGLDGDLRDAHSVWCRLLACGPTALGNTQDGAGGQREEYEFALPSRPPGTITFEDSSSDASGDFVAAHHDSSTVGTWYSLETEEYSA